jgi:ubiquitin-like protein ATG12
MASSPPDTSAPASPVLEGRDSPDLPLTMTASTVLMTLPRDATAALAAAGAFPQEKIVVRFKPVGSAPPIRRDLVKVASAHKFESVVAYLRKTLKVGETESVFLYVNSTFAPALDEVVGNLWRVGFFCDLWASGLPGADMAQCFKDSHDHLNVSYSITPAFG